MSLAKIKIHDKQGRVKTICRRLFDVRASETLKGRGFYRLQQGEVSHTAQILYNRGYLNVQLIDGEWVGNPFASESEDSR